MAVGITSQLFQGATSTNRFSQTNKFRVHIALALLLLHTILIFYFMIVWPPFPTEPGEAFFLLAIYSASFSCLCMGPSLNSKCYILYIYEKDSNYLVCAI
jgi:hypothetical protein